MTDGASLGVWLLRPLQRETEWMVRIEFCRHVYRQGIKYPLLIRVPFRLPESIHCSTLVTNTYKQGNYFGTNLIGALPVIVYLALFTRHCLPGIVPRSL